MVYRHSSIFPNKNNFQGIQLCDVSTMLSPIRMDAFDMTWSMARIIFVMLESSGILMLMHSVISTQNTKKYNSYAMN